MIDVVVFPESELQLIKLDLRQGLFLFPPQTELQGTFIDLISVESDLEVRIKPLFKLPLKLENNQIYHVDDILLENPKEYLSKAGFKTITHFHRKARRNGFLKLPIFFEYIEWERVSV